MKKLLIISLLSYAGYKGIIEPRLAKTKGEPRNDIRQYLIDKYVKDTVVGSTVLKEALPKMSDSEVQFLYEKESILFQQSDSAIDFSNPVVVKALALFKKYSPVT
ncbi:MAG: hypothetical protein EP332_06310 [Bacteroidetes bacterium]|nr:MAG: hypothetical protein EP332_06310 [Bacteroidota bacterium]